MSTEANKRAVLRRREELWNNRNLGVIDDLAAPDYVGHMASIPEPVGGPEALKQRFATYLATFVTQVTPELLIAEDELVVVRDTN